MPAPLPIEPPIEWNAPAIRLARRLLGCVVVRRLGRVTLRARIVETEAYTGPRDEGSRAYRSRRTPSSDPMFMEGGHAYIYFTYGMHHCFNVVSDVEGVGASVLVRAAEVLAGESLMRTHRPTARSVHDVLRGPGSFCRALALDRTLNRHDLRAGRVLWIEPGPPVPARMIARGPRVGLGASCGWRDKPLRFAVRGSRAVSRPLLS